MGQWASDVRPLLPTVFLFDWYWYASPTLGGIPDLQGPGGGTFLSGALEQGFLKAAVSKTLFPSGCVLSAPWCVRTATR